MLRKRFLSMVLLVGVLISQSVPRALAATTCDHAQFISDLTAPDGSTFAPGAPFTKTWRLMNIGTCTWSTAYKLVWVGGDSLDAPPAVNLPVEVPPGQMVDVPVNLTAPASAGHFKALFKISNASGVQFGIGDAASDPFWVDINVVQTNAVIYDFVASAPYAQWKSGAGALPFPGTSGDSRGFAYPVNTPHLEDDSLDSAPGLLVVPQNKFNGYIQATYPEFQIAQGDRLQTLVNCEFGATSCYVTFRIDYLLPNGVQRTLWSWKEAYDKRFYRADIDLSPLAGQKVRFVFMLLSTGFASGDRALWGSPRIVRMGSTQPPAPPATLTPLPPLPATPTPLGQPPPTVLPSGCDRAAFVTDVTVPDGTIFAPGAAFTKTWRLKNSGSCAWTTAYKLVYYSGDQMNAPTAVNLPWNVPFDQTVDISVNMVAPGAQGKYRGFWILSNASGQLFGIGSDASKPVWVEINVAGESPIDTGYDFTANVCSAEWRSTVGALPCPGTDGASNGFVLRLDAPKLEDGTTGPPGLLTVPQNRYNGYIQGFYPTFTVQPGDKFQTAVGCEYGASCSLTYRLDYMAASGYIATFWQWREQNEGRVYNASVDLSPLAGRSVRFILTILATGSAANDRALWGSPRIARTSSTPPTLTPIPPINDWLLYTNPTYGFEFKYPPQAQIINQTANTLKLNLPFSPGTNLHEKYLEMIVRENVDPCRSPLATSSMLASSETVVINGISFLKETGGDGAAGNFYDWVAYSAPRNNACISMDFVLHSVNAGNYSTPPPIFDKAAESALFTRMMETFAWTTVTPVPPTVPPVVVPSPNIRKLSMMDPANGWATSDAYVLHTTNGGATWYNVTPPTASSVRGGFFLNASQGWFLSPDSLYRTADGGASWTRYYVPFNGGTIQFLDQANGFVLSGEPSGMHKHAVYLYKTSDGGATWIRQYANDPSLPNNTLPFSGTKNGMTFRDASTGWVNGYTPTPGFAYFYKTINGGVSWAPQSLPIPAGYESADINAGSPRFFGANDAVMPVWISTGVGGRNLFLYVTHDGGTTWTVSPAAAPNSFGSDFVSVRDGFSIGDTGLLHVTNDSGANWIQITPNVPIGGDFIPQIDFVSTTMGWALKRDLNGNAAFYRTSDGGATWTLLFGTPAPVTPSTPLPDLTVTQLRIELQNPSCFTPGDLMGVRTWVKNNGAAAVGSFAVRINGVEQTVNGLAAGETTSIFFNGYSNPVDAAVDPANSIVESDETNNVRTDWVAVPTPPLPCSTPTFTPTPPVTLTGPYAVIQVTPGDVLNIRAGVGQPVVGSFPSDAVNIMRTGPTLSADNATWVEVQRPDGGTGWVNAYYLTEYVSHEAFCADTRVQTLIDQWKGSVNQSNGDMFAALISPKHGMNLNYWPSSDTVYYTPATAQTIFSDPQVSNWGSGGGSGQVDTGTFAQVVQPEMIDVLNSAYQLNCDALTYGRDYTSVSRYANTPIRFYSVVKPPTMDLDWKVWLIRVEYVNGQPYLFGAVHYVWEP
jgi:photosystem II stability/assembly factor-like uncharacterized protein